MTTPPDPLAPTKRGRALPLVLLTLFIDLLGFSLLFPIFAELMLYYQAHDDGLLAVVNAGLNAMLPEASDERRAAFFGGIVLGIYAIVQFLSAPWWGRLSDRIGRRPVLLITTGINVLGYAVWVFSGSFFLLLVGRLINGFAAGNLSTLTAAAADCSTTAQRTKVMGAVGATFGAGFLLGPAIGGMAYSWLPNLDGLGWGLNPFSSIAIVAFLLSVINIVLIARLFPETRVRDADESKPELQPVVGQRLRPLLWAYFIFMISFTTMELALVFMVRDLLAFTPAHIAWLFVTIGGTSILIQGGVVRRVAHRVPDALFASVGMSLFACGLLGLAAVSWYPLGWLAFVSAMVTTAGSACIFPSLSSWVSKLAPAAVQGAAMGRLRSLGALARVIGPLACAVAYFSWGPFVTFVLSGALLAVPLILLMFVAPRQRHGHDDGSLQTACEPVA